jgi:hypothetical protein
VPHGAGRSRRARCQAHRARRHGDRGFHRH